MDFTEKEKKTEEEMSNNTNTSSNKNIPDMKTNIPNDSNSYLSDQMAAHGQTQYKNVREYAQALHCWLWQYRMLTAVGAFHSYLMNSMPPPGGNYQQYGGAAQSPPVPPGQPFVHPGQQGVPRPHHGGQQQAVNRNRSPISIIHLQGTHYKVPMLWKRVAAELLDFVLLFYAKILITVSVLRQMGYVNENILELEPQFDFLADITEMDYNKMFTLTSELIALEVINRMCVTIVETLCIRHGYAGSIGGATPGKKIMHLRVISYDQITELRNNQILVTGERDPGFMNALVRSVIKNFSMAFFFPACFTVFFFRFRRAAYDVLSQTVVVEVDRL